MFKISKNFKEDTREFLGRFRNHKKKLFLVGCGFGMYFSRDNIGQRLNRLKSYSLDSLDEFLKEGEVFDRKFKNFLKQSLKGTFKDDHVKREGVVYLEKLLKDKKIVDNLLKLLLKTIKEDSFVEEGKILGKKITISAVNDQNVQKELIKLFQRIFNDPEIKFEAAELLKGVFKEPDVTKEVINIFASAFENPKIQSAMKGVLATAFYDILSDKETAERVKIFLYNFFKSNEGHDKNSILDLVLSKLTHKKQEQSQKDLDKFFQDLKNQKGMYDKVNFDELMKDNKLNQLSLVNIFNYY